MRLLFSAFAAIVVLFLLWAILTLLGAAHTWLNTSGYPANDVFAGVLLFIATTAAVYYVSEEFRK